MKDNKGQRKSGLKNPRFRFAYFSPKYEETLSFYRDGLELTIIEAWDRTPDDRGTLFEAASGIIEVLALPRSGESDHLWDARTPQGAFMVIELENVESLYRLALAKGLPIQEALKAHPWGHRAFCLREPNGLTIFFFSEVENGQ